METETKKQTIKLRIERTVTEYGYTFVDVDSLSEFNPNDLAWSERRLQRQLQHDCLPEAVEEAMDDGKFQASTIVYTNISLDSEYFGKGKNNKMTVTTEIPQVELDAVKVELAKAKAQFDSIVNPEQRVLDLFVESLKPHFAKTPLKRYTVELTFTETRTRSARDTVELIAASEDQALKEAEKTEFDGYFYDKEDDGEIEVEAYDPEELSTEIIPEERDRWIRTQIYAMPSYIEAEKKFTKLRGDAKAEYDKAESEILSKYIIPDKKNPHLFTFVGDPHNRTFHYKPTAQERFKETNNLC